MGWMGVFMTDQNRTTYPGFQLFRSSAWRNTSNAACPGFEVDTSISYSSGISTSSSTRSWLPLARRPATPPQAAVNAASAQPYKKGRKTGRLRGETVCAPT